MLNCYGMFVEYYEGSIVMLYWMINCYGMVIWVIQKIYCGVIWMLNCYGMFEWVLRRIYYYDIMNVKLLWIVWMSITKNILLCYGDYINHLWNVWLNWWLASANGIWDGWLSCDWWLASTNGSQDRWLGCIWWLASANGIRDGWLGCD